MMLTDDVSLHSAAVCLMGRVGKLGHGESSVFPLAKQTQAPGTGGGEKPSRRWTAVSVTDLTRLCREPVPALGADVLLCVPWCPSAVDTVGPGLPSCRGADKQARCSAFRAGKGLHRPRKAHKHWSPVSNLRTKRRRKRLGFDGQRHSTVRGGNPSSKLHVSQTNCVV